MTELTLIARLISFGICTFSVASALILSAACGRIGGSNNSGATPMPTPIPAPVGPKESEQIVASQLSDKDLARFELTLNAVSLAVHWDQPQGNAPRETQSTGLATNQSQSQDQARKALSDKIKTACEFTAIENHDAPTDPALKPNLTGAQILNTTTGQMIHGGQCPIKLAWKNSTFVAFVSTNDPHQKAQSARNSFSIRLSPLKKDLRPTLDLREYKFDVISSSDYSVDSGAFAMGTGYGWIDSASQGRIELRSMVSSTVISGILNESIVIKFVYSDGRWLELGQNRSRAANAKEPTVSYFLSNNSIDEKTYNRYLFQLGLDKQVSAGL